MNRLTDQQLLREYAGLRWEAAFAELVCRHVNFVHSAAVRMVCDEHLAEDVTQSVFAALAQNARQLAEHPVLSGWLHRTAQNLAANVVRSEVRRRAREQEAVAMNELLAAEPDARWEDIAPQLDAALGELGEADRDALLLRYFEHKSAPEMAAVLGISTEAAQKRVTRAVERLREFFSKRNVTIGASGLAAIITANAVQAAPAGLALTICTATLAGTAVSTSTIIAATKTIAMTTLQKTVITAVLAAAAGTGIFEAHQATQLRGQVQTLQEQQAPLVEQIQQLQRERDDATNRLAGMAEEIAKNQKNNLELLKLRNDVGRLKADADSEEMFYARHYARNINLLKSYFEKNPKLKTPELQFLTADEWVTVAASSELNVGGVDQEKAYCHDASKLRNRADFVTSFMLEGALAQYEQNNNGRFPDDVSQLKPYLKRSENRPGADIPIEDADEILNRWQIVPASQVKGMIAGGDMVITQKAPVDDLFDVQYAVGSKGFVSRPFVITTSFDVLTPVRDAYKTARGVFPPDDADLLPYVTTPEEKAAVDRIIQSERWDWPTTPP